MSSRRWPNKEKDICDAENIMGQYADPQQPLGLFEIYLDKQKKRFNFRVANWVVAIASHFESVYGSDQGDYITRKVLTRCITKETILH